MDILNAEKRYLLNLDLEKAINQNKPEEVTALKQQINNIAVDEHWHKLVQLYNITLHALATSTAPDFRTFTGEPFDNIIKSASSLLDIRRGIENLFEQPIQEDPNNIPLVYQFEEQLIAPRLPIGATIRHYEVDYLSDLLNAAYTQVTHKIPDNFCQI